MAADRPIIDVRGLRKSYWVHKKAPGFGGALRGLLRRDRTEKPAVRGIDFQVDEAEIVGLLGANGAGKTTVVKMLCGIVHPDGGEASVLGATPWQRSDDFRRQIALVMGQKAQLWWDLPASDSFELLREIYRIPKERFGPRVDELTSVLEVRDQLAVPIRRLSLGERMKMELVAALLHSPKVLFLDEPTIGLDLTAQRAIREFLLRIRETERTTMILTSHYMEDIEALCERVIILREGELVHDAPLAQVVAAQGGRKRIVCHVEGRSEENAPLVADLERIATVDWKETELAIEADRDDVARCVSLVLERTTVVDLTVEEPDVGTIIEGVLRQRGEGPNS